MLFQLLQTSKTTSLEFVLLCNLNWLVSVLDFKIMRTALNSNFWIQILLITFLLFLTFHVKKKNLEHQEEHEARVGFF